MTTIQQNSVEEAISSGNPADVASGLQKIQAGRCFATIIATFAELTSAAAVDITTAASKAACTYSGIKLDAGENLPPIGDLVSLRVTAGTAGVGPRQVTDSGGTAAAIPSGDVSGIALLSDDGKTLTFDAAVTGFVLVYRPRAAVALSTTYNLSAP